MTQGDATVEEMMTSEERALFEKYKAKVGKPFTPPNDQEAMENETCIYFWNQGREAVGPFVRRWASVNEDYNDLYFDEEYAKQSRWEGLIAPPLYLISVQDGLAAPIELFCDIALPGGGLEFNTQKFPNLVGAPQGYTEWEFFEPVRIGDVIDAAHTLADLYWKAAKQKKDRVLDFSRMLFIVGETTYTNQKGQLVAKSVSCGTVLWK